MSATHVHTFLFSSGWVFNSFLIVRLDRKWISDINRIGMNYSLVGLNEIYRLPTASLMTLFISSLPIVSA